MNLGYCPFWAEFAGFVLWLAIVNPGDRRKFFRTNFKLRQSRNKTKK